MVWKLDFTPASEKFVEFFTKVSAEDGFAEFKPDCGPEDGYCQFDEWVAEADPGVALAAAAAEDEPA